MLFPSHMTNILPMSVDPLVSFCVWTPSRRILTSSSSTPNASSAQKSAPQSEKEEIKNTKKAFIHVYIYMKIKKEENKEKERGEFKSVYEYALEWV